MLNNQYSEAGPELQLLAGVRREHAEPDADTVDRMRHVVLNATPHGASPAGRVRRPWRIAVPVATTAFALTALLATGVLVNNHPGAQPTSQATAATATNRTPLVGDGADANVVMTLAAQSTQTTPQLIAGPGQYIYRKTTSRNLGSYTYLAGTVNVFESQQRQDWLDPRKGLTNVRYISTDSIVGPVTAQDAKLAAKVGLDLHAAPRTVDSDQAEKSGKGGTTPPPTAPSLRNPTQQYLDSLPTNPVKLLAVIRQQAKSEGNTKWSTDKTAFGVVSDLIAWGDPILSPELRAGLYRALALMPGISRVPGTSTLNNGVNGVAIGFAEGATREEIIFDPIDLHPLGSRDITLKAADGVPAGTAISVASFEFKIVNGVGKTN
jgi:negative regulator of sigma E activity